MSRLQCGVGVFKSGQITTKVGGFSCFSIRYLNIHDGYW